MCSSIVGSLRFSSHLRSETSPFRSHGAFAARGLRNTVRRETGGTAFWKHRSKVMMKKHAEGSGNSCADVYRSLRKGLQIAEDSAGGGAEQQVAGLRGGAFDLGGRPRDGDRRRGKLSTAKVAISGAKAFETRAPTKAGASLSTDHAFNHSKTTGGKSAGQATAATGASAKGKGRRGSSKVQPHPTGVSLTYAEEGAAERRGSGGSMGGRRRGN